MPKLLISIGMIFLIAGTIWHFFPNATQWIGRLPGDISIKNENVSFYFPLATSLVFSLLLSFVFWLLRK